jgi:uncharacterized protein YkwD
MSINAVDVLLIVVVLLVVFNGYRRGFILGFLDLLGWTFCLLAALRFYRPVSQWLGNYFHPWPDVWTRPIAFAIVGILAGVIVQIIGHLLLRRLSEETHAHPANRVLGIIPGLANGLITAALLSTLLLTLPLNEGFRERARDSALVNRLAGYTERLEAALQPVFSEAIAETINMLTVRPESHERVNLPYKVAVSRPRPDLEAAMLQLVNKERVAAGLRPLAPDPELTEVARKHSADMFARGYFAHDAPDGRDPFDRMREAGVRFTTAGENLALAPSVRVAHTGLMNSPGHRANILQKDFGRLGIGIMDGGVRGLMVSQEFRNP